MKMNYEIGELAEKYEVGGRGPGYISNGDSWDPGGDSYGSYQLATKVGTLQGYLKTSLPYVSDLNKYTIKSVAFNAKWKAIATQDPIGFKQSQFDYVATISYIPCRHFADTIGILDSFAVNSCLFSTSNQSGGWKKILVAANIVTGDSEKVQINKLYDARKQYFQSLSSLSPKVKAAVIKQRTVLERADCLNLISAFSEAPPDVPKAEEKKLSLMQIILDYFKGDKA